MCATSPSQSRSSALAGDDLIHIARRLAQTDWTAEQIEGVAPLAAGLLEGVNALANFEPAGELPAVVYRLPEWE